MSQAPGVLASDKAGRSPEAARAPDGGRFRTTCGTGLRPDASDRNRDPDLDAA